MLKVKGKGLSMKHNKKYFYAIFLPLVAIFFMKGTLAAEIFVSPTGLSNAVGNIETPTTLSAAIERIKPNDVIYVRGGEYILHKTLYIKRGNDGLKKQTKKIFSYKNEQPILNFSSMNSVKEESSNKGKNKGIKLSGNYWHIKGLIIEKAQDNGIYISGHHNVIERVVTRFNADTGIQIGRLKNSDTRDSWPSYNLVISCESHDNKDETGENADGFAAKLTSGPGNVFRYDVAHHNSDDGWDLFTKPKTGAIYPVIIEYSIAYANGQLTDGEKTTDGDGNGFKLGGQNIAVKHIIRRNLAYANQKHGFTYNHNLGSMNIIDNVAINNLKRNFSFIDGKSRFSHNLSCQNSKQTKDRVVGHEVAENIWWQGTNNSKCSPYLNKVFTWSFLANGELSYQFQ